MSQMEKDFCFPPSFAFNNYLVGFVQVTGKDHGMNYVFRDGSVSQLDYEYFPPSSYTQITSTQALEVRKIQVWGESANNYFCGIKLLTESDGCVLEAGFCGKRPQLTMKEFPLAKGERIVGVKALKDPDGPEYSPLQFDPVFIIGRLE